MGKHRFFKYLFCLLIILLLSGCSIVYINKQSIDEIINTIEREGGFSAEANKHINEFLLKVGYRSMGKCDDGCAMVTSSPVSVRTSRSESANYCIIEHEMQTDSYGGPISSYYSVIVFFRLDIPILRSAFKLDIKGDTSQIYSPITELYDCDL